MREGILSAALLAPVFAKVMIFGPEDSHGLSRLKTLLKDLNRSEEWIFTEFGDRPRADRVTHKIGLVIAMNGTFSGSLVSIRSTAREQSITCLLQALTSGETRKVLDALYERRKTSQVTAPKQASTVAVDEKALNGHHDHGTNVVATALELTPRSMTPSVSGNGTLSEHKSQVASSADAPTSPVDPIEVLETFGRTIQDVQLAVMEVADQRRDLELKCQQLADGCAQKDKRIRELKEDLQTKEAEVSTLSIQNEQMKARLKKIDEAFHGR